MPESHADWCVLGAETAHYYPTSDVLLATEPPSRIDPARVAHFRARIEAGDAPLAFVATSQETYDVAGWAARTPYHSARAQIVDGHH